MWGVNDVACIAQWQAVGGGVAWRGGESSYYSITVSLLVLHDLLNVCISLPTLLRADISVKHSSISFQRKYFY
jgi:hypothetical protein